MKVIERKPHPVVAVKKSAICEGCNPGCVCQRSAESGSNHSGKKGFYNKCWGSEAERQSHAQHFSLLLEKKSRA